MTVYLRITQFWLLLLATAVLSLSPSPPGQLELIPDKLLHGGGYFLLILAADLAYPQSGRAAIKFLALLGFSTMIEIFQHFIPGRQFSWLDIVANLTGLAWGLLTIHLLAKGRNGVERKM